MDYKYLDKLWAEYQEAKKHERLDVEDGQVDYPEAYYRLSCEEQVYFESGIMPNGKRARNEKGEYVRGEQEYKKGLMIIKIQNQVLLDLIHEQEEKALKPFWEYIGNQVKVTKKDKTTEEGRVVNSELDDNNWESEILVVQKWNQLLKIPKHEIEFIEIIDEED